MAAASTNTGVLIVTNSTFSGNSAHNGGGIFNYWMGTLTVTNSTLSGNPATNGSGLYNSDSNAAYLAGNVFRHGTSGGSCYNSGLITDNGYNLSDDDSCGFSGTSVNNATLNLGALATTVDRRKHTCRARAAQRLTASPPGRPSPTVA